MFYNLDSLIEINLSNFDTSYITTMKDMFYGCTTLNSIDIYQILIHIQYLICQACLVVVHR